MLEAKWPKWKTIWADWNSFPLHDRAHLIAGYFQTNPPDEGP